MDNDIFVVGYPKSGNTWLARLLADALDSPLTGLPEFGAVPIGAEGANRPGAYVVRQLHLVPDYDDHDTLIPDPYDFVVGQWRNERVVLIMRDPRDVAVSCMFYWGIPGLRQTITDMYTVEWPISFQWADYNRAWLKLPIQVIRYEYLAGDTLLALAGLLHALNLEPACDIEAVVERQSFQVRKKDFEDFKGHYHPYGTEIQIRNLRKGTTGDWRNHFTRDDALLMHDCFFEAMREFGYEDDPDWWKECPENV